MELVFALCICGFDCAVRVCVLVVVACGRGFRV